MTIIATPIVKGTRRINRLLKGLYSVIDFE